VRGSEIWQLVDVANEAHFITTTGAHCSMAEKEAGIRPARILEGATDCVLTQKRLSALELVECIRIGIAAGAVAGAPARPAAPVAMAGIESHVRHGKSQAGWRAGPTTAEAKGHAGAPGIHGKPHGRSIQRHRNVQSSWAVNASGKLTIRQPNERERAAVAASLSKEELIAFVL
jgi:hypothetical protein